MSVLETFVHDPLVEWKKSSKGSINNTMETEGMNILETISNKLTGGMGPTYYFNIAEMKNGKGLYCVSLNII